MNHQSEVVAYSIIVYINKVNFIQPVYGSIKQSEAIISMLYMYIIFKSCGYYALHCLIKYN